MALEYFYVMFQDEDIGKFASDGTELWRTAGRTLVGGPVTWTFPGRPAVDSSGNWYFGQRTSFTPQWTVYAVDPDGAVQFTSAAINTSSIDVSIDSSDNVFVGGSSPQRVQKYVGGSLAWELTNVAGGDSSAHIAAAGDGGVYLNTPSGRLIRRAADGSLTWDVAVSAVSGMVVDADGFVYMMPNAAVGQRDVIKIDPTDGSVLYSVAVNNQGLTSLSYHKYYLGADGFIYVYYMDVFNAAYITKIDPADGSTVWAQNADEGDRWWEGFVVDDDGGIYVAENNGTTAARKFDQSLTTLWSYDNTTWGWQVAGVHGVPAPPEPPSAFWRNFVNTREILEP